MAEISNLKEFAEALNALVNSNNNVAELAMPIDYQDTSLDTLNLENQYQLLLSQGKFNDAHKLRIDNPVLETRILDAAKLNYLQTLMLTAYQYAKEERSAENLLFDNSYLDGYLNGIQATNIQDAIEEICEFLNEKMNELYNKSINRHVYCEDGKLPAEPDPDTFYYLEEE